MSDKSDKIETIENAGVVEIRGTRAQRFKRHCGRRWWIYLIATLLVILALVLGM